jgi:predicted Zn-dependent protease
MPSRIPFALAALALVAAAPTPPLPDPRLAVLTAMKDELTRTRERLRLDDHEPPYFLSFQVKEEQSFNLLARYGALFDDDERRDRRIYVDVRVGNYELDNSSPDDGGPDFDALDSGYMASHDAPLEDDAAAVRASLWLAADEQYKRALSAYLRKRGKSVYQPDEPDRPPSFSREEPQRYADPPVAFPFDRAGWRDEARAVSALFRAQPDIFDSSVRIGANRTVRYFTSSEGTELVTEMAIYGVHVTAVTRAPDGMLLENGRDFYGATEAELPRGAKLRAEVAKMVEELLALRQAPVLDPYTGPALLAPEATGVLFHETIGHRLEGERQHNDREGRTFKGQVGKEILPAFLSIYDDPTQRAFAERSLNGYYRYDDQGVPAQRVGLVEKGVLKSYLLSRAPVKGFVHSNGHGRAQSDRDPVARMGNLIVEASRTVPDEKLKKMLLEEARKQGKPYALLIKDIQGGNTNTSGYGYQAFKGIPRLVYRVDAKTGKEELVRGVEIVGTPLTSINKVIAMGDKPAVFNGYCGAESGFVPVSTVAPATLIGEIELQRVRKESGRPPVLPAPWTPPPEPAAR